MKKRNKNTLESKYWLLILSIMCVVLMLLSWSTNGTAGPAEFVASYTVVPMQKGINSVGVFMRDFVDNFDTLEEMHIKNEELQQQVDELTLENGRLQQNSYELERLQELYQLDANSSEYEKVGARVISKEPGNWFSSFTIDKGSLDGIEVDMNVIAGTGLVGIVTKVGPNWANVRSIIDDASNISAMVLSTGDGCIVQGDLTLMDEGVVKFSQLANNENEVIIGEQLVTSYISDRYVQGLTIGLVTSVQVDSNNLTRSGYITPVVDFSQLQEVLVITKIKEVGEESQSDDESIDTETEEETEAEN